MQCIAPSNIVNPKTPSDNTNRLIVPCGKCAACLTNRRTDWTNRITHELENSTSAHFITLTYNDDNITYGEMFPTLVKSDLQKFFKSLRKAIQPIKVRYYAVGEYGTETHRPHYHIILFNLPNEHKEQIEKCWKNGFVHIGTVTRSSIHYVTKYHLNKTEFPEGSEPSFATMSRRPGIGYGYIAKSGTYHEGKIDRNYLLHRGGIKSRLPRYYKDKLFTDAEKRAIARKAEEDSLNWLNEDVIEEHYKNNPDVNYFDYDVQKKIQLQNNYKSKINKNEKL